MLLEQLVVIQCHSEYCDLVDEEHSQISDSNTKSIVDAGNLLTSAENDCLFLLGIWQQTVHKMSSGHNINAGQDVCMTAFSAWSSLYTA